MARRRAKWVLRAWVGAWLAAIATGEWLVVSYAMEAAPEVAAAATWPQDSSLARAAGGPTLLVFLHPHCPCSRATLAELERLLARAPAHAATRVVLAWDGACEPDWDARGLRERAAALGIAEVALDPGALEARRFGATTSGEVLLYAADGTLAFQGGITPSRGHEGESVGRQALAELLHGREPRRRRAPAYGCALLDAAPGAAGGSRCDP